MLDADTSTAFAHHTAAVNSITVHHVDEGSGPRGILLHGFPCTGFEWRRLIGALALAGLRVVAPDIRGFGETSKPSAIEDYTIFHGAGDVVGFLGALGDPSARLFGHDLGLWVVAGVAPARSVSRARAGKHRCRPAAQHPQRDFRAGERRRTLAAVHQVR